MTQSWRGLLASMIRIKIVRELHDQLIADPQRYQRRGMSLEDAIAQLAFKHLHDVLRDGQRLDALALRELGITVPRHIPDDYVITKADMLGTTNADGEAMFVLSLPPPGAVK